ncbi:FadR/GntR family transcriptional regulator [Microbacterium sp. NPDC055521]
MRLALDSAAPSLAAAHRTDADVELLADLLSRRRASWSTDDLDLRASTDLDLHKAIVAATHNPLFVTLYSSMLHVFAAHMRHETSADADIAHTLHADLVTAIAWGDADHAADVVAAIFAPHMS